MTHRLSLAFTPVSITLPAWEHAIEVFDFSQWERRQFALIKAAQDAWNLRSDPDTQQVIFSLTLFVRLGGETAERTQTLSPDMLTMHWLSLWENQYDIEIHLSSGCGLSRYD